MLFHVTIEPRLKESKEVASADASVFVSEAFPSPWLRRNRLACLANQWGYVFVEANL